MDVGVTELRANLSHWLEQVAQGEQVVITERGIPVARLLGVESRSLIEDLEARGVIIRPRSTERLVATGRQRVKARGSKLASDLVSEQRD